MKDDRTSGLPDEIGRGGKGDGAGAGVPVTE